MGSSSTPARRKVTRRESRRVETNGSCWSAVSYFWPSIHVRPMAMRKQLSYGTDVGQNEYYLSEISWAVAFAALSAKQWTRSNLCSGHRPPVAARHAVPLRKHDQVGGWAIWGAALRSRAAGSQDESCCSAIDKQRPYPNERRRSQLRKSGAADGEPSLGPIRFGRGILRISVGVCGFLGDDCVGEHFLITVGDS